MLDVPWRWSALALNPLDSQEGERVGFPLAPGRFPRVGHMPALTWDLPALLDFAIETCGPTFWLDRGFDSYVLQLTSPEGFSIFRNKATDSSFLYEAAGRMLGRSMITIDGREHKRVRGAATFAFSPAGLDRASVGRIIAEVAERRVERWRDLAVVPIGQDTREMALEVIFRIIGIPISEIPAWRHHYEELMLSALNIPFDFPGSPARRGRLAEAWIERETRKIIHAARRRDDDSLLGALVRGQDDQGRGLTDDELVANLRLLVFAGHETTASVLAWAFLHLAHDGAVWRRLREEAMSLSGVPASMAELAEAPLAEAVFRESLRLYPPVVNDVRRVSVDDYEVDGQIVPRGTILGASIHHLSRDPERYPEPHTFRPLRWLGLGRRPNAMEMCQFGGGPHFCLGYHVAILEGVAVLVAAARALGENNLRPAPMGRFPRPRFLPIQRPPRKACIGLLAAAHG